MAGVQENSLFLAESRALRGREGINLLVHACRSNSLFFSFLLFKYSPFLFFFSFFSFFLLFFSILVFYSSVFQVPIVVLVSSPIHDNGLFLWCLPWSGFTILTLNYLCLVLMYLPTTTGPSVCHYPSLDKRKLFICLFAVAPFLAMVWVPSLSLSHMACT